MIDRLLKKHKIPCIVLVYDQTDIIAKSLSFLIRHYKDLDIYVVENPSSNSDKISKLVSDVAKTGNIKAHYRLEENITGNAYALIAEELREKIYKSKYVLITDGDVTCDNTEWLKEELMILDKHQDVWCCGISMDLSNLPLQTFPDARSWIPNDISIQVDYYETITGIHLLLNRTKDFFEFLDWKTQQGLNFVDGNMHKYCYDMKHKKWARTKQAQAYHLTWDLYADARHPYTKMKTDKSFKDHWHNGKLTTTFSVTYY